MRISAITILFIINVLNSQCQVDYGHYLNDSIFIDESNIQTLDQKPLPREYELTLIHNILDSLQYSGLLYENAIQGFVIIDCKIDASGTISSIKIIKSDHDQLPWDIIKCLNNLNKCRNRLGTEPPRPIQLKFHFGYGPKNVKQFKNGTFEFLKHYSWDDKPYEQKHISPQIIIK
jgi:hypothetical protein